MPARGYEWLREPPTRLKIDFGAAHEEAIEAINFNGLGMGAVASVLSVPIMPDDQLSVNYDNCPLPAKKVGPRQKVAALSEVYLTIF